MARAFALRLVRRWVARKGPFTIWLLHDAAASGDLDIDRVTAGWLSVNGGGYAEPETSLVILRGDRGPDELRPNADPWSECPQSKVRQILRRHFGDDYGTKLPGNGLPSDQSSAL